MDEAVRGLNALLMMSVGLALGAWLARRWDLPWALFGIGAATFVASQVAHIPFNALVLNRILDRVGWSNHSSTGALLGYAALAGLSAGLFEEGALYLMYRFWAKKARSWEEALMIGAGHGGIEALLLGLLTAYGLLQAIGLRGVDLASAVPANRLEAVRQQLQAYWATPWYGVLLGALERLFAICLHLSGSVIVLQCFTRRQWFWLPLAIGWHALADGAAVSVLPTFGPYATEALVGLMALISLVVVFGLRQRRAAEAQSGPPAGPTALRVGNAEPPTREQLDDSRFSGGAQV